MVEECIKKYIIDSNIMTSLEDEVKVTRGLWNAFVKLITFFCCVSSVVFCLI